ncbi:MAG: NAD(P)/FAD-dependent oxidoreductase [Proteobacteria bacterium]|uniref:flavin-containing monooxygenase n=1 Tax=Aquabacterium sp. TaxID=1872578 RepID=UPI0035C70B69|nr:NAD(P)/FAD-dependent oxidoreductase [Pseudomonadota bacterium]
MDTRTAPAIPSSSSVLHTLIVGAGFGGIGMAIALQRQGVREVLICEKASDVGGCWRENTYPGAACDVPSHLYSFSFAPKPDWSRKYAPQPEILAYLREVVARHGLAPWLRLNTEVSELRYLEGEGEGEGGKSDKSGVWEARLDDGQTLRARFVVTACGQLSKPLMPRIPGMDSFAGVAFHSARWRHDVDLRGKRVAVIGTGASAIQFIPQIAQQAAQVTVFQRSAPYVIPKPDRPYRAWEQRLFASVPLLQRLSRGWIYLSHEARALAFTRMPWLMAPYRLGFERNLRRQVPDAALRQRLTPDHPLGCKRILISNDFYAAMGRPNVELVSEGVAAIEPQGVRAKDGQLHAADVIVYGTGFAATEFLTPMRVRGRGGLDLHAQWQGGAQAWLGMAVSGFPNLFMLYGPNTNLGHNSIVYMLESQIEHVARCMRGLQQRGQASMEVPPQTESAFNARLQALMRRTVWSAGCTSWYQTADGRNPVNWPGFTISYRWLTRRAGLKDYVLR